MAFQALNCHETRVAGRYDEGCLALGTLCGVLPRVPLPRVPRLAGGRFLRWRLSLEVVASEGDHLLRYCASEHPRGIMIIAKSFVKRYV